LDVNFVEATRIQRHYSAHMKLPRSGVWPAIALLLLTSGCAARTPDKDPSPTETPALPGASARSWPHRSTHTFDTHMESSVQVALDQALVSFAMDGKVLLQVRDVDARRQQFVMRVQGARFTSTSQQQQFEALGRELEQPLGFTLLDGALERVEVHNKWSNFAASTGRALAAAFQLPPEGSTAWTAVASAARVREVDATGVHRVDYRIDTQCEAGHLCLSKQKVDYDPLPLPPIRLGSLSATLQPKVVSSAGKLVLGPAGAFASFVSEEKIDVPMGPTATMASQTKLSLRRNAEATFETVDWELALRETRSLAATAPYLGPMRTTYDALRVGDYTFDSALAELVKLELKDKKDKRPPAISGKVPNPEQQKVLQERAGPFRAMAAILRTQPENVPRAVAAIKAASPAARQLLDALAMAETQPTVNALMMLLKDPSVPLDWKGAVASGLIRSNDTRPEVVEALRATLREPSIRVHALYGLGSIARKRAEQGDATGADAVAGILVDVLSQETQQTVLTHALRGISNSGRTMALAAVSKHLESKQVTVRAAAVQALRLMVDDRADQLIARTLINDKDKLVRRAAAEAAVDHQPTDTLSTAVQAAIVSDPDTKVRKLLLDVIERWLPDRPELKAALELLQNDDQRPSVRERAGEILAKHTRAPGAGPSASAWQ
jgi:HEAT repeat protein